MRVVTVGTSKITSVIINELRQAGIEVYACVSRDLLRAKEFANRNGVERFADNYEKVLKSNDFDFVYIGLPNNLHFEYAKKALEYGKNVILEKPFCVNQRQAKDLITLALSRKLFIFENMRTYHSLSYKLLQRDINKIKPIRMVQLNYSKYSSAYDQFKQGVYQTRFNNVTCCGALMDLNCYNVSFIVGLFGLPMECKYTCTKKEDVDISGVATLKYNDFICNLVSAKDSNAVNFVNISGENGYIYFHGDPSTLDGYELHLNNQPPKRVNYKELYPFVPVFKDIETIYQNKDYRGYDYYMKLTLMEMRVLDDLRKSSDIRYAADRNN